MGGSKRALLISMMTLSLVALGTSAAAVAAPAGVLESFTVTATLAPDRVFKGETAKMTGKVIPPRPGESVKLQQKKSGKWKDIDSNELDDASRYSFTITGEKAGTPQYRVFKGASGGVDAGTSPVRKLSVYRWIYLSNLQVVDYDDFDFGSFRINGKNYPNSIGAYYDFSDGYAEWNIDRKCDRLLGVGGVDDTSDVDVIGEVTLSKEGEQFFQEQYTFGTTNPINVDVTGILRLRVDVSTVKKEGYPAIGNARVSCTF